VRLPQYSNVADFTPPPGVVTIALDKSTNLVATASCPDDYNSVFIEGSEPKETCDRADQRNVFQRLFGGPPPAQPTVNQPARVVSPGTARPRSVIVQAEPEPRNGASTPENGQPKKKRGFWGSITGIFGNGSGN
jgi:penicillin-binding protein 1B